MGSQDSSTEGPPREAEPGAGQDFDALFARSAERLLVFLRLRMGPELCARLEPVDALQEVYLKASGVRERFTTGGDSDFARWLCRIAENHLQDLVRYHGALRRRPARPPAPISAVIEGLRKNATGPVTAAGRAEEHLRLREAIAALEEPQRAVVLMRFFQGRNLDEIAHRTGRSPTAVRRLLGRATASLGSHLGADGGNDDG